MLFMVIETFKTGCKEAVYQRFERSGRMLPEGLEYVGSWLEVDGDRCFQIMRTHDRDKIDVWTQAWDDLTDFEVVPIIRSPTSAE